MVSGFATSPISYAPTSWAFFMDGKACARVEIVAGPLTTLTTLTVAGGGITALRRLACSNYWRRTNKPEALAVLGAWGLLKGRVQ
jgi:hypothetical protein